MEANSEIWKVCEADSRYEVSNMGRVRHAAKKSIRKPSNAGCGYLSVVISTKAGHVGHYIHHLVARAFIGVRPDGAHVSHLNGDKSDNRAANLIYESPKENMRRKLGHGTENIGERNGSAKLTTAQVQELRRLKIYGLSMVFVASAYGISPAQANRIGRNENWKQAQPAGANG